MPEGSPLEFRSELILSSRLVSARKVTLAALVVLLPVIDFPRAARLSASPVDHGPHKRDSEKSISIRVGNACDVFELQEHIVARGDEDENTHQVLQSLALCSPAVACIQHR